MRKVVITGLGMVSPVGLDVNSSWQSALNGISGVAPIQSFDATHDSVRIAAEVKNFNPSLLMDSKEVRRTPRFIQFAVSAAKEAIDNAGLDLSGKTERYGCSIGVGIGSIHDIYATSILLNEGGPKKVSPFFIPYVITNMAAGIVSNRFKLQGPNICPTTACTSGTHAIGEAFLYIKEGMADVMICGGSEAAICEITMVGFGNMKALSKNNADPKIASRPFDKNRDGFVMGEGAGLLVIEEKEHALARGAHIYAELIGYGMSGDAYHITSPSPHGDGAKRCMKQALASAKLKGDEVDYINAHGTSTYYNDMYESEAVANAFGAHAKNLAISSTKGVTGHCLGAAGGIEAVFLAKTIAEGIIPPTANLQEPDPLCPLDYVPRHAREAKIRVAMSNSFGFGGTNGCIVMADKDFRGD
ncbi:MAG: beta-ketoacyl-ACP synthase II [Deltaproteobacteria bacterium]|nr:beta-ketoacyl-ACP synthase II [Deltaproteobacteria bacterium]